MRYDAVLLAGGRATRFGGIDKTGLIVGGQTLLERVLAAVAGAQRRIVVGGASRPGVDVLTCEDPPGGGPVAGLAAGLARVDMPAVVVLAADLPFVTPAIVDSLLAALGASAVDAAMLVDDGDRDQLLVAAWRTQRLRERVAAIGDPAGQPVRLLFEGATVARVGGAAPAGRPPPWLDCDTDEDLRRAREWM